MKYKIIINSKIKQVDTVYRWLELLIDEGVNEELSQKIMLVSQEITTNSILHGNRLIPNKSVTVDVDIDSNEIIIRIKDEGEGIIELPSKEEAEELDYLAEHGRGLKLAVLMSDKIEIDGNSIKIVFKLN